MKIRKSRPRSIRLSYLALLLEVKRTSSSALLNQLITTFIPESVINIYDYAFAYNTSLTNFIFEGNYVNSIGNNIFYNSNNVSSLIVFSQTYGWNLTQTWSTKKINLIDLKLKIINDNNYSIYSHNIFLSKLIVPKKIGNSNIIRIDDKALINSSIENILIPDTITSIGDYALSKNKLSNIIIPNSVKNIGVSAFSNNLIINCIIPDSITIINNNVFMNNLIKNIIIPNSIIKINSYAFANNQLTSIIIPNSVTTIGSYAFTNNQLTSIIIPNSITSIGDYAFANNYLLDSFIFEGDYVIPGGDNIFLNNIEQINVIVSISNITWNNINIWSNMPVIKI